MRALILFLFLIFSFNVSGQPPERIQPKIIAGIMGAQIDGDRLSGYNKPGAIAGIAMEMRLGKKFSLQPEIMYNQKGARSTEKSLYYGIYRLNYIDLNAVLNFYLTEKIVLQPGIGYGLLFKARTDRGSGFVTDNSYYNATDLGFLFGVEYKFTPKTAVNIRYGYSILSIVKGAYWYNNTLSFTLRFMLGN